MRKIEDYFDWVSRIVSIIVLIGFITSFISYSLGYIPLMGEFISLLVLTIVFFIVLFIVFIAGLKRKYILCPRPRSDFKLLEKEIAYKYLDEKHMEYTKRLRLKALRSGLDRYPDRYSWTGSGTVNLRTSIDNQDVKLTKRRNVWQLYDVYFGRPLNKGEEIEVKVIWNLYDEKSTALPFASSTVEEPLDLLKIKIILPDKLKPQYASCVTTLSLGGVKTPISSFEKPFNEKGENEVEWIIKKPKLLHTYEISWEIKYK